METLTEIQLADTLRRNAARVYEQAVGVKTSATANVERLLKLSDYHVEQLKLIGDMLALADALDPTIAVAVPRLAGAICGETRKNIVDLLVAARRDQQTRYDDVTARLEKARADLERAEHVIANA